MRREVRLLGGEWILAGRGILRRRAAARGGARERLGQPREGQPPEAAGKIAEHIPAGEERSNVIAGVIGGGHG